MQLSVADGDVEVFYSTSSQATPAMFDKSFKIKATESKYLSFKPEDKNISISVVAANDGKVTFKFCEFLEFFFVSFLNFIQKLWGSL